MVKLLKRQPMRRYELWSTKSRNLIKPFPTRDLALSYVRTVIERRGVDYADRLILIREDSAGASEKVAEGSDLVGLARMNFIEQAAKGHSVRLLIDVS